VATFAELSEKIFTLKREIDELMMVEGYLIEDVAAKAATLNQLLQIKPEDGAQSAEYSLFLTDQLQWFSVVIAKLNEEKKTIASHILRSQRRKKAEKMYGENK
jgi:uncharacterized protein YoxC